MPNHPFDPGGRLASAAPRQRRTRVLVAEDDAEMRQIIVEALAKDGYEILEAETGQAALVLLASHVFGDCEPGGSLDLLVSDIRMPGCSGSRILELLRTARRPLPVILMTAFGDEEVRRATERLGGILLQKPFDVDDLLRTARRACAGA